MGCGSNSWSSIYMVVQQKDVVLIETTALPRARRCPRCRQMTVEFEKTGQILQFYRLRGQFRTGRRQYLRSGGVLQNDLVQLMYGLGHLGNAFGLFAAGSLISWHTSPIFLAAVQLFIKKVRLRE